MPPVLVASVTLEIGSCFCQATWTAVLLSYTFCHDWDDRHLPLHPAFFPLRWGLTNFFLVWASLELHSSQSQPLK
jgi:hypothetical protein